MQNKFQTKPATIYEIIIKISSKKNFNKNIFVILKWQTMEQGAATPCSKLIFSSIYLII